MKDLIRHAIASCLCGPCWVILSSRFQDTRLRPRFSRCTDTKEIARFLLLASKTLVFSRKDSGLFSVGGSKLDIPPLEFAVAEGSALHRLDLIKA